MKKLVKVSRALKQKAKYLVCLLFLYLNQVNIYASEENKIANSTVGKGTKKLFEDLSKYGLILSPIVGGLLGVYFFTRMNVADEQDQKQWKKRILLTIICTVGAFLISGIIKLITSYYQ